MNEIISNIQEYLTSEAFHQLLLGWAGKLLLAVIIFIVGRWIAKLLTRLFRKAADKRALDPTVSNFTANLLYYLLLLVVLVAALSQAGLQMASVIAILGAAGLAVGLALKDSLSNFAAGIMLVMFRPFRAGDYVDVAGVSGTVTQVKIFSTILTTPDNVEITVPNNQVFSNEIKNYTANGQRRIDLMIGVSYDDDLKLARSVIEKVIQGEEEVLDEPEPVIWVHELGDSSVNFAVRPWVRTEVYWPTRARIIETIKFELEAAGCSIPYPQRDVHLFSQNAIEHTEKAGNRET